MDHQIFWTLITRVKHWPKIPCKRCHVINQISININLKIQYVINVFSVTQEKNKPADEDEDDDDEEDEEVVAYLSGADEDFDPSTLPDPDNAHDSESSSEEDG